MVLVSGSPSKIIMLYTLNLYSAVCQLYLNKTERKKAIFAHYRALEHTVNNKIKTIMYILYI